MQSATRRRTLGLLYVVLLAATAAHATPVIADEDPLSSSIDTVSTPAVTTGEAWAIPSSVAASSVAASSATDPGPASGVPAIDSASDTVPDPTDVVSESVRHPTDVVSDTVSDATGAVSGSVSDATGPVSTAASGATGSGSDHGIGVGASPRGTTPSREGQGVPCDAQTNTCIPDAGGGSLAAAVKRVLGFLALTGSEVLPWIVIAVGLAALGIFLLRPSRRPTSRT
jgi:hypothetical protein